METKKSNQKTETKVYASGTCITSNFDKTLQIFADHVINRMQTILADWQKPWLSCTVKKNFIPQNISGRHYSHGNAFMLAILCEMYSFKTPVFLTFLQAKELNLTVKKGSHSFPVYYVCRLYYHNDTHKKITEKEYKELPKTEREKYHTVPCLKSYNVFNLDLTDYAEKYPESWLSKQELFKDKMQEEISEMYVNSTLDDLFNAQTWVCPVRIELSNEAFYSPIQDYISLPLKRQFNDGESFYSTALHEMSHSTGTKNRLNRKMESFFGTKSYGREELVAELSATVAGLYLGVSNKIRENNIAYLNGWIKNIKEEPKFLMSVLGDVSKTVKFIFNHISIDADAFVPVETDVLNV